jgi:hypothetical protein
MDVRFGKSNVWILCRAGSLKTVTSELVKYNLDQMADQEVTWDEGVSHSADDYIFFQKYEC